MDTPPALLLALVLSTSTAHAVQDPLAEDRAPKDRRVEWLRERGAHVRSVDPADDDFADLAPLAQAIGEARVVQLGEQSHGDGTCFLAKCRLVRFLHRELGFDVLAWESGFFPCARMNAALHGEAPVAEVAPVGLFPVWSRSRECLPVLEYARSTHGSERPLEMAGFDVQLSGTGGLELGDAVLAFFDESAVYSPDPARLAEFAVLWEALVARTPLADGVREAGEAAIVELAAAIPTEGTTREAAFVRRSLEDLALHQRLKVLFAARETMQEGSNLRDVQMGRNVAWLADEYYAGRKIIVWAASRHIAHDLDSIETQMQGFDYGEYRTMGDEVHELLGEDAYTILFDAYEGRAGIAGREPRDLEPAPADSLTSLCHATGAENLFLDLRADAGEAGAWLREPLVARPLGHAPMRARWHLCADAFFFTATMAPSTAVE